MLKEKKTERITVRVEPELLVILKKWAEFYNMPVTEYCRLILWNHWKIEP